jgi:hypothetical protein
VFPPTTTPTAPPAPAKVSPVKLPPDGTGSAQWWTTQLDWAADVRKTLLPRWQKHVNAYLDELTANTPDAIRVNIEYEKTEQKRHQLFPLNPALSLKPNPRTLRDLADPATGAPRDLRKAVAIFKERIQRMAGPKELDTKSLIDMLCFDVLCPAGLAMCKVGYERFEDGSIPVQIGTEEIKQPGSILGLQSMTVPKYGEGPNIVYERYFASRISMAKALIPPDFTGKHYSRDCDWLAYDFFIYRADALARKWKVPKGKAFGGDDDNRLVRLDRQGDRSDQLKFREVFFYASRIDSSVAHPQKIRRLVFIDGVKEPVVCEDYKDQRWDARGRLAGGLKTLPLKVLTLRYVSDSPFPPSDCRISGRQGDELSEFRSLQMLHKRKARSMRAMDINRILDDKVKAKILNGENYYDIIPVDGDPEKLMALIPDPQVPRDNYAACDYLMADVNRLWAMGEAAQGVKAKGGTTATEIAAISSATAGRLEAEKAAVVKFWVEIMEDEAALVQLYADTEDYVEIVGPDGAKSVEPFTKHTVAGMEFLFDIVPDSASPPDAAADRDLALNRYNLLANDPFIVREQLVRDTVETYGGDPDRLVKAPEPAPPEKPKIALSIKGEDLNPMMPQYANVVAVLEAAGVLGDQQLEPPQEGSNTPEGDPTGAAGVVDRERLRMAAADEGGHARGGALVGADA